MRTLIGRIVTAAALLVGLLLAVSAVSFAAESPAEPAKELESIGKTGPKAIGLKIWTNKDPGQAFLPGERAIIYATPERQAYLTIVAISSEGDVTVIFPNKLMHNNMLQPHRLYTLFGDDFPVRLSAGERPAKGKLLCYLSAKPFELEPIKSAGESAFLTIPKEAEKELKVLKEKLREMAKDEGFSCTVVLLSGDKGDNLGFRLTEVPRELTKKGLPGGTESTVPETLTGSAGLKPLREDKLRQ
jgi:hypothetical protein